jgi:hypothetical protein
MFSNNKENSLSQSFQNMSIGNTKMQNKNKMNGSSQYYQQTMFNNSESLEEEEEEEKKEKVSFVKVKLER